MILGQQCSSRIFEAQCMDGTNVEPPPDVIGTASLTFTRISCVTFYYVRPKSFWVKASKCQTSLPCFTRCILPPLILVYPALCVDGHGLWEDLGNLRDQSSAMRCRTRRFGYGCEMGCPKECGCGFAFLKKHPTGGGNMKSGCKTQFGLRLEAAQLSTTLALT